MYRVIENTSISQRGVPLHQGSKHPEGIAGYLELTEEASEHFASFALFALSWFGCTEKPEEVTQSCFYNGNQNRIDIGFTRENYPCIGDNVVLEICFEPGFPMKRFIAKSFPLSQEFLDRGKKRIAASASMALR